MKAAPEADVLVLKNEHHSFARRLRPHPINFSPGDRTLETHPESPPATMGSSFGGPNGGLEDQQKVEKVLDFSCIYGIA